MQKLYAVGCSLLLATALLFAASAYFWATQPIASEAQIQAARARVAQGRSEIPTSCPRPVLRGVALPGDGDEGLRGFTNRFPDCFALLGRDVSAAREVFLTDEMFRPDEAQARPASASPPAFEQLAAVACVGVDTALQALLQQGSGCTAQPWFVASPDNPNTPGIEDAMLLLARARIHEGRLQEGIELLLDVIRLGQDLSRGAANLEVAHRGLALQLQAAEQLNVLVASELPWTSAMLDELARQAQVLVSTMPEPAPWFVYEAFSARLHALEVLHIPRNALLTELALRDIAVEDYAETRSPACTGVTLEACRARHRVAVADMYARVVAGYRWDWLPSVVHRAQVELTYIERLRDREHVLTDAARTEALLRALPALFLHRRMSLSGTCPSAEALQAEARAAGVAEGFEIVASTQSILLWPPRVYSATPRPSPETELLYRAYCPTLRAP